MNDTVHTTPYEPSLSKEANLQADRHELQAMVDGLTTRVDVLVAEVERLTAERATERNNRWQTEQRLISFQTAVRETLIGYWEENTIPFSDLNPLLESLGLDPVKTEYLVEWEETYTITVALQGTVSATDEDEARNLVRDDPDAHAAPDLRISDLLIQAVRDEQYDPGTDEIEITEISEK